MLPSSQARLVVQRSAVAFLVLALTLLVQFAPSSTQAAAADVGYEDGSWAGTGATRDVTGEKPESKLWWNAGTWWGSLWDQTAGGYRIHRLDLTTQTWQSTGVLLDSRANSRADVLWDGQKLYVASHIFSTSSSTGSSADAPRLYRYSYDAGADMYTLDAGFPVSISPNNDRVEALTIAEDSTGQLWATWVRSGVVYVTQTTNTAQTTWGTPQRLNAAAVDSDDISAMISVGSRIAVLWSNQIANSGLTTFYFALHNDNVGDDVTTWASNMVASRAVREADDHINLKLLASRGSLYAAVKTSTTGNSDPRLLLLTYNTSTGVWRRYVESDGSQSLTRPIILIDESAQVLHYIATDEGGGAVYEKTTPLSDITFGPGKGTLMMYDADSPDINALLVYALYQQ